MFKKFINLTITAALTVSLVACGGGTSKETQDNKDDSGNAAVVEKPQADSDDSIQVGIVLPTKDEPRWLQDQKQFETLLNDAGFTNQVLFSQGSSATEKTNVETLITKGIKILIISAHDGGAAAAATDIAKKAGIQVIAYDRLITGTDSVDYYVTFDSEAVGRTQAQYLIDNAKGEGTPLYLYAGADTDNNSFLFFKGAWEALQPKIADGTFVIANSTEAEGLKDKFDLSREEMAKIIGQVTTSWDFSVAKSKAESNLSAASAELKGDVAILAPNDGTARSIADTFATDSDVTSYLITGQDSEKASVQYIIDGKQSMTVFKDTRDLASDSIQMATDMLNGKDIVTDAEFDNLKIKVPSKQTKVILVTKENVKEVLIDSGYYDAAEFSGLE